MKYIGIAISILIIAVITFATVEKVSPVGWGWWGETNTASGVALHGYDPVSYFDGEGPTPGSDSISTEWAGAVWLFANEANRQKFLEDPDAFAPEFGGFCAFAVSKGFTADPSPAAWHVDAGKLYAFADEKVRDEWVSGIPSGSLVKSRENWSRRD